MWLRILFTIKDKSKQYSAEYLRVSSIPETNDSDDESEGSLSSSNLEASVKRLYTLTKLRF